jgi:hypothetical protein
MGEETRWIEKLGEKGLDRVRLARGVVGNTTYAVCCAFLLLVAVAFGLAAHPYIALSAIAIICGVLLVYLFGTWIFAHRHPDQALLGGAELLQWRQMDMAAKGIQLQKDQPNIEPTPLIEGKE